MVHFLPLCFIWLLSCFSSRSAFSSLIDDVIMLAYLFPSPFPFFFFPFHFLLLSLPGRSLLSSYFFDLPQHWAPAFKTCHISDKRRWQSAWVSYIWTKRIQAACFEVLNSGQEEEHCRDKTNSSMGTLNHTVNCIICWRSECLLW